MQKDNKKELDTASLAITDIVKVKSLYPKLRPIVYNFLIDCENLGLKGGVFCGVRTFQEQDNLYAQGRTKPGSIVTNAKGGFSWHNYGLAIDFVFKDSNGNWTWNSPQWKQAGEAGIKNGLEWGGTWSSFPDRPHFQKTYGQVFDKLIKIYNKNKKLQDVWDYLDTLS